MGLFWDLIQQDQINTQKQRAESLEDRVTSLENELAHTHQLLMDTLHVLERHVGQDIEDGKIG